MCACVHNVCMHAFMSVSVCMSVCMWTCIQVNQIVLILLSYNILMILYIYSSSVLISTVYLTRRLFVLDSSAMRDGL